MQELYTTFDGRIRRGEWWKGVIILVVVVVAISLILNAILGSTSFLARLVSFLIGLAVLYPYLALGSKRLHDRGKPMLPWMAIFIGPAFVLNIMQVLGIGFRPMEVMGDTVMMPTALGTIMGLVSMAAGLWGLVELGILKGTEGPNEYGPDPRAAG